MDTLDTVHQQNNEDDISLNIEHEDEEDDDYINNNDSNSVYESDSIVKISQQPVIEPFPSTTTIKNNTLQKKEKSTKILSKRRKTIDSLDLRQFVLRKNNLNDLREQLTQSLNLNKHQIVIDYNILAFIENIDIENDNVMEERMKKFIEKFQKNYKGVQHAEYKINNKLYCAIDVIYFLPILFHNFEYRENHIINRKILDGIVQRLDILTERVLETPAKKRKLDSTIIPEDNEKNIISDNTLKNGINTKSLRLYSLGNGDFYLMYRKKQNFIDGQKNLEKKFGKCKLLKMWNDTVDIKDVCKLLLLKFPQLKWNARTNILTNSKTSTISGNDLVNHLVKILK